jgi:MarR family transcriptional regulator, lower aerobic nicotinate degradation pathway regulator
VPPDPLVDALVQASFAVQEVLAAAAGRHDLSVVQARLLGVLRDREPGMAELARFLRLERSSVTGLVDRAERRGLVARAPAPHDGRGVVVALTPAGRDLARVVGREVGEAVAGLLADVPARDRASLTRSLERLVATHAAATGVDLAAGRR